MLESDEQKININEQLYGNLSVDDAAMINADPTLDEGGRAAAIMDPETYKFNKSNPYILRDSENYPAIFASLEQPSKYYITRSYQNELQKYEDELKEQQRTMGPFEAVRKGYSYSYQAMKVNDLQAKQRDAIHDGNTEEAERIGKEIEKEQLALSQLEAPNRSGGYGAVGALGASVVRELPMLVGTSLATAGLAALAAPSGGATAPAAAATGAKFLLAGKKILSAYRASKAAIAVAKVAPTVTKIAQAAYIYNDTANIEGGAIYSELKKKHPDWNEQEIYDKSVLGGRIIGGLEAIGAFVGSASAVAQPLRSIAGKAIARGAASKTIEKMVISSGEKELVKDAVFGAIEKGIIKPAIMKSPKAISKLVDGLSKLARTRTAEAVKFGADVVSEAATEVYQDKISDIISSLPQGEEIGYSEALVSGASAVGKDISQIYDYWVNGGELSKEARETLDTLIGVGAGTALFGGASHGVDVLSSKIIRNESHALGNQIAEANKAIGTFDTILNQKKDGELYKKSPETSNEFYKNAVKTGELPNNVYVGIDDLNKILDEVKNDPVSMAKINALKIPEKIASGEDVDLVSIPTEDFIATVVDPNNDTLYQKIKGSMTTNPAMESKDSAVEMVRKIAEEDPLLAQEVVDENSIYNMVLRSQRAKGASEKQAKFNATIMQTLVNSLYRSQKGVSYEDIVKAINLRIENVDTIQEGDLLQTAYAGSRVDYDTPSLEAIGSGEGAQVHGWGLYYALNRDVAERYRASFVGDDDMSGYLHYYKGEQSHKTFDINGDTIKDRVFADIYAGSAWYETTEDWTKKIEKLRAEYRKNIDLCERALNKEAIKKSEELKGVYEEEKKDQEEKLDFINTINPKDFSGGPSGQVHEVDIPESPYLLDEQKKFSEQSQFVQEKLKELAKENTGLREAINSDIAIGRDFYVRLGADLASGIEDVGKAIDEAPKLASKKLESVGIKGITYEGRQDGRAFVIFNPDSVKVLQKFYQTTQQKYTDDIRYQYAGRNAKTASLANLSQAVIFEQQNMPMADIFKQTGWFKDPRDGQWKFEISDKDATINEELLKKMFANKVDNQRLGDVMKHDKLYAAYPEFADVEVIYNSHLRNTLGQTYTDRRDGRLKIEIKKTDDIVGLRKTILHELAHRIQRKEDFGKGGSPGAYSTPLPSHLNEAWVKRSKLHKELWAKLKESGVQPSTEYPSHARIQDARQYLNKIAEKDENVQKQLKRLDELDSALKRVDEGDRYMKYFNLPGENEARDVEARSELTDEQRRNVLPANLAGVRSPIIRFTVEGQTIETPVNVEPVEQIAGAIQFGIETIIQLAKIENPTTFAHEGAHLFGRQLFGAYNAGTLTDRWVKNTEQLAEFLELKKDENGGYQFAGNTAAEEKFAEAFTSYLKTGKSPASYLKDLFDLAFEWFANIYKALRMSEVPLNKKVTQVFDEIFVPYEKQQQIMEERRYGFIPRPSNMTVDQYEAYKKEKRAAAIRGTTEEVKRAAKLQEVMSNDMYKAEREDAYNQAYESLGQLPVYKMIDDVLMYKINRGSLAKISKDIVIPSNYLSSKKGVDITQLLSEYTNLAQTEDGLAEILATTPSRETAANYMADKHMEEWLQDKYPEIAEINSETAARNEKVFKLAVMEYMMLSGIGMERFNQIHNDLLATSEYMVSNMPLKKMVNVQRWIEQESKLMQRYDYTSNQKQRAEIKRQQAILNYYAMRAKQISVDAKKFNRHSKKYRGPQTKEILKTIDGESFDLLKSMLGQFKLTQAKPNRNMPMAMRIDAWVDSMARYEFTGAGEIERYKGALVDGVEDTIKVKDFEFLKEAFSFVESVGQKQKQVIVNGVAQNVEDAANSILEEYNKHAIKPLEKELGQAVMMEAVVSNLWPTNAYLTFFAPVYKGLTRRDMQMAEWEKRASEIIEPMERKMQNKVLIDGRTYTNENLLVMMLNSGNTHNINCMVKTLQFKMNDPEFSVDDLFSALNQAPKELREMTRQIWQIFDDNKQQFQEAQRQIDGKVLKFVEPEAYEFDDGEMMHGGYYPAGQVLTIKNFENESTRFKNEGTYATKSFQRERTAEHGDLDLTLGTLNSWFYKMSGVLHLAVPYNNMAKLMRNDTFRRTVGDGMVRSLRDWLNLAVTPDRVNQTLAAINQVASVSVLGLAPIKMFTQLSGVIPAMNEVGPFWIMKGISETNPIRAIHEASKLSEYMYARYAHPEDHLHLYMTAKNTLGNHVAEVGKDGMQKLSQAAMCFIIYGDAIASTITWKAEFAKQKAAGYTDAQASDLADSKVRMLQGDASAGSRAKIIQGNMRFFTMFASYFIGLHSLVKAHGMKHELGKAIGLIFAAAIAAPMFEAVFKTAWKMATSDDDDRRKWQKKGIEDAFDLYLDETIKNIASTAGAIWLPHFGIGGDIGTAIATGRTYAPENIQVKYMLKPIEAGVNVMNAVSLYSVGEDEKAQRKLKKGLQSLFEYSMLNPSVAKKVSNIIIGE